MLDTETRAAQVWRDNRWVMWFLMTAVTANIYLKVFTSWHKYDRMGQFMASLLVLAMLVFPWRIMLDLKNGKRMHTEQLVLFAYMLLMMSENVFGR